MEDEKHAIEARLTNDSACCQPSRGRSRDSRKASGVVRLSSVGRRSSRSSDSNAEPKRSSWRSIYIGGGNFIHAPQTGDVVKISPLDAYHVRNWAGARRLL